MATESNHGGGTQQHPPAPPSTALAEAVGATIGMAVGTLCGAWLVNYARVGGPWAVVLSVALAAAGFIALMIAGSVCGGMVVAHVRAARRR